MKSGDIKRFHGYFVEVDHVEHTACFVKFIFHPPIGYKEYAYVRATSLENVEWYKRILIKIHLFMMEESVYL